MADAMSNLFRSAQPKVARRGVHLDLKGCQPTFPRLLSLLKLFAACRYNFVLVEWEDTFPWTVDERFRSETAYTPEQVRDFVEQARKLNIELIPLVQCLGHMETPLMVADYTPLRENPMRSDDLNPLATGARELVEKMIEDVLRLIPGVKYFHLGGDEARSFGTNPATKAYIEENGKGELYLHHVGPMLDKLNARRIRPILWHDMMIDWSPEALKDLARRADLMPWGYNGRPDSTPHHYNIKYIRRFKENGITLWGATAYKGGDSPNADLTSRTDREANAIGWMDIAEEFQFIGVVATGWSRKSTHRPQYLPIDGQLDVLVNVAVILHDGQPPEGGREACIEALHSVGEGERFEKCYAVLKQLTDARMRGWHAVQMMREQLAMRAVDPKRKGAQNEITYLRFLRAAIAGLDAPAEGVRQAFADLIPSIWIERYLGERIAALHEELRELDSRAEQIEPEGYAALAQASALPRLPSNLRA